MKNIFRKKLDYNYAANVSTSERALLPKRTKYSFGNGLYHLTSKIKGLKNVGRKGRSDGSGKERSQRNLNKIIRNKNLWAITALILISVFLLPRLFSQTPTENDDNERISVMPARAEKDINRTFKFPIRDENNDQVGELEYTITKAELLDELVVQGKRATAIEGRTFLIISLKLKNELGQSPVINTKDYIRLSVNGNKDEWLAPDIHNDPVTIQAISTKNTRVGFPINDSDKDLVLRVGEIKGEKEEVPIEF